MTKVHLPIKSYCSNSAAKIWQYTENHALVGNSAKIWKYTEIQAWVGDSEYLTFNRQI